MILPFSTSRLCSAVSVALFVLFTTVSVNANTPYKSATALDQYGSSPQINNARLASELHSMPTIAVSAGSSVVIATLERRQLGGISRPKCKIIGKSQDHVLAIMGSGLAGDAAFIERLLRRDVINTWERYDNFPNCHRVAATASRIMLAFMGYNDEIQDGTIDILMEDNGNGQERLSIGRPLAVNLIVTRIDFQERYGSSELILVEPSGISTMISGKALGRGCKRGGELLRQRWNSGMDLQEAQNTCIGILRDVAKLEQLVKDEDDAGHGNSKEFDIVLEVLDSEGLHVKRIPFGGRNQ